MSTLHHLPGQSRSVLQWLFLSFRSPPTHTLTQAYRTPIKGSLPIVSDRPPSPLAIRYGCNRAVASSPECSDILLL